MYTMFVPREWGGEKRDRLISLLDDEYDVECRIFNPPVHKTVSFVARHTEGQDLPLSEELGGRIICPPIHPTMSAEDNEYIAAAVWDAVEKIQRET
jgi:perosamine synthetase